MNINFLIAALILGFVGWILHLIFILSALRKPNRGQIIIDYNYFNEMCVEIILIITILIFQLYNIINFLGI